MALVLAASGCDDPTPVVLGRLQTRVRDGGSQPVDGGEHDHEREHDRDNNADESPDRAEHSARQ